jgi:hypothetical protein
MDMQRTLVKLPVRVSLGALYLLLCTVIHAHISLELKKIQTLSGRGILPRVSRPVAVPRIQALCGGVSNAVGALLRRQREAVAVDG